LAAKPRWVWRAIAGGHWNGNKYLGDIDPIGTNFGQASLDHTFSAAGLRWDNLVLYRTPDIDGFQAALGYSFAVDNDNSVFKTGNNTRGITAGLRYLNGPLNVSMTYEQLRAKSVADATVAAGGGGKKAFTHKSDTSPKMYAIGATYDFEVVKVAAAYARTTDGLFGGAGLPENLDNQYDTAFVKGSRVNSYMLGLSAPIDGGSNVFASWQRAKPNNDRLSRAGLSRTLNGTSLAQNKALNVYSIGYTYDFSKRTNLYVRAKLGVHQRRA